jgi:acetyl esterase/lipase
MFAIISAGLTAWVLLAPSASGDDAAQVDSRFSVREGLLYSQTDRELRMDLFLPERTDSPSPCVVVIQGGGFMAQDGQKFRPFAVYLAEHGFAAALIAYRGRPDHTYRDTVADIKAAVRFVRKISKQNHIDPNRIGAMGRSAGGTLAGLLAVTGDVKEFEGEGGHSEFSSRIQAAVAYAGVFDFVSRFSDARQLAMQPKRQPKKEANGEWIGAPFSSENKHWRNASAVNHVDANDAPMLLLHCKDDGTVPWLQTQAMYAKMHEAGVVCETKYYDAGGHGFSGLGDEPMAEMVRFFREQLEGGTPPS